MNCPRCGSEMQITDPVCPVCGTRNVAYQPPVQQQPVQQPQQYNQQQYGQQPGYYAQPQPTPANGMAIAGFVLSFFFGLLGLIFSIVGLNKSKELDGKGRGLAIAGIIISIIGIIGTIGLVASGGGY